MCAWLAALATLAAGACDGGNAPVVPADASVYETAGAADISSETLCTRMCTAKLARDCPHETVDDCVAWCELTDQGLCGSEFRALNECLLAHPDPWFCPAGVGIAIRSNTCPDQQTAVAFCSLKAQSDAGPPGG